MAVEGTLPSGRRSDELTDQDGQTEQGSQPPVRQGSFGSGNEFRSASDFRDREVTGSIQGPVFAFGIDSIIVLREPDRYMQQTTLSPKFQIVIPKAVRNALRWTPGSTFNVVEQEGRIILLPIRSARQMRGFLRGIDTSVPRDKDRV